MKQLMSVLGKQPANGQDRVDDLGDGGLLLQTLAAAASLFTIDVAMHEKLRWDDVKPLVDVFTDGLIGRVPHRVDGFGVQARSNRPTDDHSIEAIDHGRPVHLACWPLELHYGDALLLVRCGCAGVTPQEVVRHEADFAHAGAVSPAFGRGGNQAFQFHWPLDDLLRNVHALPSQRGSHSTVAFTAVVAPDDVGHHATHVDVLFSNIEPRPMVEDMSCGAGPPHEAARHCRAADSSKRAAMTKTYLTPGQRIARCLPACAARSPRFASLGASAPPTAR